MVLKNYGTSIAHAKRREKLCAALRSWQRRAKDRRKPLSDLALGLGVTLKTLQNMMRKGPRVGLQKAQDKRKFLGLCEKRRKKVSRTSPSRRKSTAAKDWRSSQASSFGLRQAQRVAQPLLLREKREKRKRIRANQRCSQPISSEELQRLSGFSRHW